MFDHSRLDGRRMALGGLPVVILGLLLVTFALLSVPWPPDQPRATRYGVSVSFWERLQGHQVGLPEDAPSSVTGKDAQWQARRLMDSLALVALLAGYLAVAALLWFAEPHVWLVLCAAGAYGMVYGSAAGLYPGPILTAGGFGLILCGAGLAWLSRLALERPTGAAEKPGTPSVESVLVSPTGIDER